MDKLLAMATFVEIVERGSLTGAADALDKSLPSVVHWSLPSHIGPLLLRHCVHSGLNRQPRQSCATRLLRPASVLRRPVHNLCRRGLQLANRLVKMRTSNFCSAARSPCRRSWSALHAPSPWAGVIYRLNMPYLQFVLYCIE